MPYLYKFLPRKYLFSTLTHGNFRIGLLSDFRKEEQYGNEVGDKDEGILEAELSSEHCASLNIGANTLDSNFLETHFLSEEQRKSLKGIEVRLDYHADPGSLVVRKEAPDSFLFCSSSIFDSQLMRKFGDACIRIENPDKFFAALSRSLRHRGHFECYKPVTYMSRRQYHQEASKHHPALVKGIEHQHQYEVRAIWRPLRSNPRPFIVTCRDAAKFCEEYKPQKNRQIL